MKVGSLVEVITDFEELREVWGFNYPRKGDVLTILQVEPHHKWKKINLLWFEELTNVPGICNKTTKGIWNFKELLSLEEQINSQEFVDLCYKKKSVGVIDKNIFSTIY